MALKALILKSKIERSKKKLEELRKLDESFQTRADELTTAFNEINEETSTEDVAEVEKQITDFDAEREAHDKEVKDLEQEIEGAESELAEIEAAQADTERSAETTTQTVDEPETRTYGGYEKMKTRSFNNMTIEQRDAFFGREEIKDFAENVRKLSRKQAIEQRALKGGELLIPQTILSVLRENIAEYSKLYKHVNVVQVSGTARQPILGAIPEAIWTEMCGNLNELDLEFTAVEVDGYKVGGYIAICNALIDDSDANLIDTVTDALGASIGFALDKAILFGTGTKMPTGIARAIPTENQTAIASSVTGAKWFSAFVAGAMKANSKYSRGERFWAMSSSTYADVMANSISFNASGAVVSALNGTMPVIGGAIETLDFIPNGVIIGGYGDLYLLAERAGTSVESSEHVRFIQDETVFKGTARYDGKVSIPAGFASITLGTVTLDVALNDVKFAEDSAN